MSTLDFQIGLKAETTVGTAAVVDRFIEFDSESLKFDKQRIEHAGLRTGRKVLGSNNRQDGQRGVSGDIQKMVQTKGDALLFAHALGSVTTTTPAGATLARQHLCKVGDIDGKSLTIQVGRPSTGGVVEPFTYSGCKVASWELANTVNELLSLTLTFDAMDEDTDTALAEPSWPAGVMDFTYVNGAVELDGAAFKVKNWNLTGDNQLNTDRYFIQATDSGRKSEQLEGANLREYGGTLVADFEGLTAYNRFVNRTPASFTATYTAGSIETGFNYSIMIECPYIEFDGDTPNVGGPELLEQSLPFKVLDDADTDGPVVITIVNDDAAA